MKYYTKYRIVTFIYFIILFTTIEIILSIFNIDNFYIGILIIFPFVLFLYGPYYRVLNNMAKKVLKTFETSCLIEDIADYNMFIELRFKRIFTKQKRYKALYYYYLTSFYAYNNEFSGTVSLLDFLSEHKKFNISKIQVLNTEMLKGAIKGDFEKVENTYIELCYCVDTEISKYKEDSNQIILLGQIKVVLGKFVELTKDVNEETIANARLWINTDINLYNAIDNYCIVKILEYHNNTEYIEEFKENIRKINGDIVFLKIDE